MQIRGENEGQLGFGSLWVGSHDYTAIFVGFGFELEFYAGDSRFFYWGDRHLGW